MNILSMLWMKLVPKFVREPNDPEPYAMVVRIWWVATTSTALFSLVLTVWMYGMGDFVVAVFMLVFTIFWFISLVTYTILKQGIEWIGLATQSFLVISSLVFSLLVRDSRISVAFLLIGLIGPLYALAWPKRSRAMVLIVGYCAIVFATPLLRNVVPQFGSENSVAGQLLVTISILSCAVSSFIALLFFVKERATALKLLQAEQEKTEHLLLNILPKPIADILRNENRVIADYYEGASVLFADVVGFTPMSAEMQPQHVVTLLNDVFSYLDTLTEKYDLEKIKTIGDCYMVASGLPHPQHDHAHRLVAMALEAQNHFSTSEYLDGQKLSFRMGINSGPVVAGVIGIKRFIYDLWGDAVNTASRMESHGKPNKIQITETTYRLVRDSFVCEAQEPVTIKGKGKMNVWHVIGHKTIPS